VRTFLSISAPITELNLEREHGESVIRTSLSSSIRAGWVHPASKAARAGGPAGPACEGVYAPAQLLQGHSTPHIVG